MKAWSEKYTPTIAYQNHPKLFSIGFKYYVMTRFQFSKEIKSVLYEYLLGTFKFPNSSDYLLHLVIGPPKLRAMIPLESIVDEIKIPIHVYYGQKDRVDSSGALRQLESKRKDFIFKYITNASHQIALEEPEALCAEIMGYLE